MKNISNSKPKVCPNCGGFKIAAILYGLQAQSSKLEQALEKGKIVLGGCVITDCDPAWQCIDCETRIFKKEDVDVLEDFTPDREFDIPDHSEVCSHCRHLFDPGTDRECKAFPEGIPMEIWMGYDQHTEPHHYQENDIIFEEKDFF